MLNDSTNFVRTNTFLCMMTLFAPVTAGPKGCNRCLWAACTRTCTGFRVQRYSSGCFLFFSSFWNPSPNRSWINQPVQPTVIQNTLSQENLKSSLKSVSQFKTATFHRFWFCDFKRIAASLDHHWIHIGEVSLQIFQDEFNFWQTLTPECTLLSNRKPSRQCWPLKEWSAGESKMEEAIIASSFV